MTTKHYVVQTTDTSVATEKLAHQQLMAHGVPTTWLCTAEQRTVRRCTKTIIKSLFPGYFFIEMDITDPAWTAIPHLGDTRGRGVMGILGAGPLRPTALPVGALERLCRQFAAGEYQQKPDPGFAVDEQLKVIAGPWTGQIGVCLLSDEERVDVMLKVFGQERPVPFRRDMLRRVG